MNELQPSLGESRARRKWPPLRIVIAAFAWLALAISALGIYYATLPDGDATPAAPARFSFPLHTAPKPLPEISFQDGQGGMHTLADFRGRAVLLNIWATWCVPCRKEMPALDRLQQKLGGPAFQVVVLSIDTEGVAAVRRFYDEVGIRALAIYVDPTTRASDKLGVIGIPTTLLVDPQGREVARRTGQAEWDGAEPVALIQKYLQGMHGGNE